MEINQVVFSHDKRKEHLKGIQAALPGGKITTIIGPNGCGKSTLLGVMSGLHHPQSGKAVIDGKAVHRYSAMELARKLAVVHQQNSAPADITVERLVGYGRIPHRSWFGGNGEEDREAIQWALACTNLTGKRDTSVEKLSGGERQRVWLAMALAQKTPMLFLDEPTTFLDMYYQLEILELVRRLNREYNLTIAMVLHDINQAIRYSDYIIAMKDGEIVAHGLPHEVITSERVREIYGVHVIVGEEENTGIYIVPVGIQDSIRR
ncbi:ABC transporter ATP-binding protein [Paenibacillus contaminans]|uniref:ABC transporter ATP-binding protein n=1 Tax=Paenibacillus contaminans TaxID=450362 RepID=A0A329M9Q2_9BACL|nr:ABC transporter ATP-binding protein [Paenibacillus contaminans]RAV15283.1 ABC transporter ATP-binding protein [Paenibacillus contaminans]